MRILYVHERFGALAGAEANAYITASELKQRGHVIGILHGPPTGSGAFQWESTFAFRFSLEGGRATQRTQAALAQFQPDIVYVHKMADLETIRTLVDSGLPLVRMVHDHDIYCMRSSKYNFFTRKPCLRPASAHCIFPCGGFIHRNRKGILPFKFISYAAKKREIALNQRFHRMVVVTAYMRDELLRNGFDPAKIVIHPPVPLNSDSALCSNFSERNLILYTGQIIRGKGVDVLLQSLALLKTPFECIILGDGSHRGYCEKLSRKLGLADRVRFAGFVPQEQLKDYYRECTVVAISSVWPEPFATVGMEVMRYGIPVVAFDVGGISAWLANGENGFLIPWMDRKEYAARLEQLLRNKRQAREMGEKGRRMVNEQFNFDRYISDLEEMFGRVQANKPAHATPLAIAR